MTLMIRALYEGVESVDQATRARPVIDDLCFCNSVSGISCHVTSDSDVVGGRAVTELEVVVVIVVVLSCAGTFAGVRDAPLRRVVSTEGV